MQLPEQILGDLISVELPERSAFPLSPCKKIPESAVIGLPGKFAGKFILTRLSDCPAIDY